MDKADNLFEKLMKRTHFPEAYYDYALYLEDIGKVEEAKEMYNNL